MQNEWIKYNVPNPENVKVVGGFSAADFRFGNWVLLSGKPIQIESIDKDGINGSINMDIHGVEIDVISFFSIEAIDLTPEILERCGFIEQGGFWIKKGIHWQLKSYDNLFYVCTSFLPFPQGFTDLHELQNLYHALEGEELIFTPS